MQAQIYWVLIVFGTQLIKKKCPVRPVFPDYLLLLMTMIYQNLGTDFVHPKVVSDLKNGLYSPLFLSTT